MIMEHAKPALPTPLTRATREGPELINLCYCEGSKNTIAERIMLHVSPDRH